jgi:hypothetical protein
MEEVEVVRGRSWSRIRLRTRKWLLGPTVDGLLRGRRALPVGWSWDSSIAGRWVCGRRSQSGRALGGLYLGA